MEKLSKKVLTFGKLAAPLAVVATLGAIDPAEAATILPGDGIFSFDGTVTFTVQQTGGGAFNTTVDFGANGFGNTETQSIDLTKENELSANGTGAFQQFLGQSLTLKDIQFSVPFPQPSRIAVAVDDFLNLNPSTGVGGTDDDTFDLAGVSAPTFVDIPGFGSALVLGGDGLFQSSSNPPGEEDGVGVFTLQFAGLTSAQVINLFNTGGSITQTYSASFEKTGEIPAVPEPATTASLLGFGLLGANAALKKRAGNKTK